MIGAAPHTAPIVPLTCYFLPRSLKVSRASFTTSAGIVHDVFFSSALRGWFLRSQARNCLPLSMPSSFARASGFIEPFGGSTALGFAAFGSAAFFAGAFGFTSFSTVAMSFTSFRRFIPTSYTTSAPRSTSEERWILTFNIPLIVAIDGGLLKVCTRSSMVVDGWNQIYNHVCVTLNAKRSQEARNGTTQQGTKAQGIDRAADDERNVCPE